MEKSPENSKDRSSKTEMWQRVYDWVLLHRLKLGLSILWLFLLVLLYGYIANTSLSPKIVAVAIFTFITSSWWGPFLYLLVYAIRPLLLFPSTVLAILAGIFFGFWLGLTVLLIGSLISSTIAYFIGKSLSVAAPPKGLGELSTWRQFLVKKPFEAVLFAHLSFLPYDAINYLSGILQIRFVPFILGTFVGIIPSGMSVVSVGASINIQTFLNEGISLSIFDPFYFGLAVVIFIVAVSLSRVSSYYQKRFQTETK